MNNHLLYFIVLISFSSFVKAKEVQKCNGFEESKLGVVSIVNPKFPNHLAMGHEGWVKMRFEVTAEGIVSSVKVIGSEPDRIFDRAASKALKNSLFSRSENKEIRCGIITMVFELE